MFKMWDKREKCWAVKPSCLFISTEFHMICTLSITQARGSLTLWLGRILFSLDKILPQFPTSEQTDLDRNPAIVCSFQAQISFPAAGKTMKLMFAFFFCPSGDKNDVFQIFSGYLRYSSGSFGRRTLLSLQNWLLLKWFKFVQE